MKAYSDRNLIAQYQPFHNTHVLRGKANNLLSFCFQYVKSWTKDIDSNFAKSFILNKFVMC